MKAKRQPYAALGRRLFRPLKRQGRGMKLILSRKGFDSSAGGCPSPLVGGRAVSLPIPTKMPTRTTYGDLRNGIGDMIVDLTNGKHGRSSPCHLDPDLDESLLPRCRGWRGVLGQVGAAQSHLENNNVGAGDLFLFWGLFRPAEKLDRWRFHGTREHRVFGWLQVDSVIRVGGEPAATVTRCPWIADHPHLQRGWPASNTVYLARQRLSIFGADLNLPGWGLFRTGHRLTAPGSPQVSVWSVPDWLNPSRGGTGMTFHPAERWTSDGLVRAASRGQEFVANVADREDARDWLMRLFEDQT